jgi:tetratricopeptide (TPR) repeat protein
MGGLFMKVEVYRNPDFHGRTSSSMRLASIAGLALVLGASILATAFGRSQDTAKADRFDMLVREDFFAGFAGDAEALARGMKKSEYALAKDPKNAEALVWHGAGLSYFAKREFMSGNVEKGRQIQTKGASEMNQAVALRPEDVAVLIPRASVFLSAAVHVPSPEVARRDFQIAADDYEKTLRLQSAEFATLPVHARGELLGGLAEAWNGLGETEKSQVYLRRMLVELPETAYAHHAKELLDGARKPGPLGTTCLGCHVANAGHK